MARIVVLSADRPLADRIERHLDAFGYRAVCVASAAEAIEATTEQPTDLLIVDLDGTPFDAAGPGADALLAALRERSPLAAVAITSGATAAPGAGRADAVVAAPVDLPELMGAVAAVLRRSLAPTGSPGSPLLPIGGGVVIDRSAALVRTPSGNVPLSPRERDLLMQLARRPGFFVKRPALTAAAAGPGAAAAVDDLVVGLRQLLRRHGARYDTIDGDSESGYRLDVAVPRGSRRSLV